MELFWGFLKIDKDLLSKYPKPLFYFLIALFFLTVTSLISLAFGKEIALVFVLAVVILMPIWWIKKVIKESDKKRKHEDWIAECKPKNGWKQKADAEYLDLEGKFLKELIFTAEPIGRVTYWRAGFMLGNEKARPQDIIDTDNAITVHTGIPGTLEKGIHVWRYDKNHIVNKPEESPVLINDNLNFKININTDNHLSVHLGNQSIYEEIVDPQFRRKLFLLAWADEYPNYRIRFKNINYKI